TGGLAAVMQAQASLFSDEDIANLAAYYASLK
ncbi:cytochrome c, partial [Vibrio parahaemolyticus]|nr:cytochrome c [Vibrio parahaemolyticus]